MVEKGRKEEISSREVKARKNFGRKDFGVKEAGTTLWRSECREQRPLLIEGKRVSGELENENQKDGESL